MIASKIDNGLCLLERYHAAVNFRCARLPGLALCVRLPVKADAVELSPLEIRKADIGVVLKRVKRNTRLSRKTRPTFCLSLSAAAVATWIRSAFRGSSRFRPSIARSKVVKRASAIASAPSGDISLRFAIFGFKTGGERPFRRFLAGAAPLCCPSGGPQEIIFYL